MEIINKIFCCDTQTLIKRLPDSTIDLVVTSPPYNVSLGNNKYKKDSYDTYNDNKNHQQYIEWLKNIFGATKRIMKDGGRICINIGDGKNGSIPTHSDITNFMTKELGYLMMTTIIWDKCQIGNRTSWGSWMSPSCPSFPTPFEYILVFANNSINRGKANKELITVTKEEFITNSLAIWKFKPETRQKKMGHPAMFPIELPLRCIQQLSYKGDTVMDFFGGLMTTCVAAKQLGRNYVGCDISQTYCDIGIERINNV